MLVMAVNIARGFIFKKIWPIFIEKNLHNFGFWDMIMSWQCRGAIQVPVDKKLSNGIAHTGTIALVSSFFRCPWTATFGDTS